MTMELQLEIIERFWSRVDRGEPEECWLWKNEYRNKARYGYFHFNSRSMLAHRFAWMIANQQDIPHELCVCHTCDVGWCCNPSHLFLATQVENMKDKARKGRAPKGDRNGRSKIKEEDALEIKRLLGSGSLSQAEIARRLGLHPNLIWQIASGTTWRHLQ